MGGGCSCILVNHSDTIFHAFGEELKVATENLSTNTTLQNFFLQFSHSKKWITNYLTLENLSTQSKDKIQYILPTGEILVVEREKCEVSYAEQTSVSFNNSFRSFTTRSFTLMASNMLKQRQTKLIKFISRYKQSAPLILMCAYRLFSTAPEYSLCFEGRSNSFMKLIRSSSMITLSTAASRSLKNNQIKLQRNHSDEDEDECIIAAAATGESRFQLASSTMVTLITPRPRVYPNDDYDSLDSPPLIIETTIRRKPSSANHSPNKIDQFSTEVNTMIPSHLEDETFSSSSNSEILSTEKLYESSPGNGKPSPQLLSAVSSQEQQEANPTISTTTVTAADDIIVDPKHSTPKPLLKRIPTTRTTTSTTNTLSQLMEKVTEGIIDDHYIQQHIKSVDFWMNQIFQFIENIPVGITIGKYDKKLHTFPLCYVNRQFEKMTKYSRQEILGKTCQMLQTEDRTEMCQVTLIRKAIMNRQSCRVVLTNVRRDGSPFSNFLYLHPVLNRQKEYTHYIGLQYDFTGNERNYRDDLVAIDDLMALLIALFW
jgi:PAS domain S-box-containing protein